MKNSTQMHASSYTSKQHMDRYYMVLKFAYVQYMLTLMLTNQSKAYASKLVEQASNHFCCGYLLLLKNMARHVRSSLRRDFDPWNLHFLLKPVRLVSKPRGLGGNEGD